MPVRPMDLLALDGLLSQEERLIRDTVRQYGDDKLRPHIAEWFESGQIPAHDLAKELGALGLLGMHLEGYGCAGTSAVAYGLACLELEAVDSGIRSLVSVQGSLAMFSIWKWGSEEQKQRWLPRMASGELIGAIAMTEPGAGSDLKAIRTRAVRDGDDYVVNGSKMFITNGFVATILMLVVRTDPNDRSRGLSILMVETEGRQGYRVGKVLDKMGLTAQDTSELYFEDMRVPASCLLGGEEGKGMHMLMGDLPYERLTIALGGVAAMEGALEETAKYVKERQVFGQPVGAYQNTRFKLAEAATLARVARVFVDRCIEQLVAGTLDTETAAMAKWWVTDTQQKVIDDCQQLFGGYGYMNEYLICRMFTDSRVQRIYGGTNEIMKELISRSI